MKGNQPALQSAIAGVLDRAGESALASCDGHTSVTDARGRREERSVTVMHDPEGRPPGWAGVGSVARVCRGRQVRGKANESTAHDYLSSPRVGAAELAGYIRRHGSIENGLHWVLDVAFREDESRPRDAKAGANLALLRRIAVALLKRAAAKGSAHTRRLRAAWDDQYLNQVLQGLSA